ncbi:flagellar assembly protein FliT [Fictibacillus aquaticus]|uniref:Flagellar protein FliT n=1 Tax=Fictibacillus aquaticus TaxID=2021314 RepID=A0A235FEH2_9BACL|nr:hypothetical protein [Fictibacillus aquaticus]OYD59721.1 hypothetical protein CGZ90_07525 [Fictibacillus aquaticus]
MAAVKILLEITKNLHDHVMGGLPAEERELYIEQLDELLQQRQSLISELPDVYSEDELKMGHHILQLNETIDPLLSAQLNEIKQSIALLKKKKQKSAQYANPYQAVSGDGMFFDKKN